jgi:DNA-3-methyladenine glycosylase I
MKRCPWCETGEKMIRYHDEEWGIPLHDDRKQFEFLMMEAMQCGLSWKLMIEKREIFRECFEDFDYEKIAAYGEEDVARIMNTPGMIRSEGKIRAVISNAQAFRKIREEFGTFDSYLWAFSDHRTICYQGHQKGHMPAANGLSDRIGKDLKRRGFKYLGSVTVYSYLQACGIINDHEESCFRYEDILEHYPIVKKRKDAER